MQHLRSRAIAVFGLSVLSCASSAALAQATQPAQPTTDELVQQIRELQAKVEQLQANQREAEYRTAAVDATVEHVLEDANRRSQLMQSEGFTAGYSKGKFIIQSADGNFVFIPWLQLQIRNTTNARDGEGDEDSVENGFELRRVKLGFQGNVFSPKTTYEFQWATNRNGGDVELEQAWVKHALTDEWAVSGGQFKDPFARESIVSSKRLLAAERALITNFFTGGANYVQGVQAFYTQDTWRAQAAFTDGARDNANQNFRDFPTNNANYGVAGRVEIKFAGDWKAYNDFTALKTEADLFVLGAAVDYTEAGNTGFFLHTIDAQYENPNGLGVYGAFIGRHTKNGPVSPTVPTVAENDLYDCGVLVQAAYLLQNNWEPFLRYDVLLLDDEGLDAGEEDTIHSFTIGANYYMHEHASKFTLDVMFLPNGSSVSDSGSGVLTSEDEQFVIRAQYQLLL